MSTIKAILEASADGTLPLPPELREGKLSVTAMVERAEVEDLTPSAPTLKGFGCLNGKIWMSSDFDEPVEDFEEYME